VVSSFKVDLLGDDTSAPSEPVVAVPGGNKTNEDLLAEIFGVGGTDQASTNSPSSIGSKPQKSTANDILSLFDSPAPSATPPQAVATTAASLFDLASPVTPSAPPPKPATPPQLPSYTAYNKNDLVISLTPQSSTQPGMVDILARFQVKGNIAATNLNFQVAVPKVSITTRI
jgi:AP-1 complex subunit gamma-1